MKIDRLIGIVTILLQKEKVTTSQLAERFEVSQRTIQRDIDNICKASIPIVSMQGLPNLVDSIRQNAKNILAQYE